MKRTIDPKFLGHPGSGGGFERWMFAKSGMTQQHMSPLHLGVSFRGTLVISYEKKKENCLETLGKSFGVYQLPIYFPGKIEDTDTPLKIKKNIHNDGGVDGSDSFSLKKKWVMAVGCKLLILQGVPLSLFVRCFCVLGTFHDLYIRGL